MYNHVQGLRRRGHHLESWCPDTADQKYLPLGALIKEHVVPLGGRHDLFRDPARSLSVTKELLQAMEDQCRSCADEINGGGFDILFGNACQYLRTTPIAGLINIPSAICLHEPFRWFYEAMPELPWIVPAQSFERSPLLSFREFRRRLSRWSALNSIRTQARAELEYAKRFDLILANSVFSRETILRTYNLDSKICYLGVDTEYYKPTGESKEPFVVGLGTIYDRKGVDRAIRAVATIPQASRPALVWIGNGAWDYQLEEYKRLAERLKVRFTAKIHILDQEVISLLSRATAMICTPRLEPFGLAPLEANACGTPVVGIAEGGIKETIRDGINGFLAREDDRECLGQLIRTFVDDPPLAARMGAQARSYVEAEWNLKKCTDTIESHLSTLRDNMSAKAQLADSRRLLDLKPTNNIRSNVEEKTIRKSQLRMKGWAHIKGRDSSGSEIFILIKNQSETQLLRTAKITRKDVTQHFNDDNDYDESGFSAEGTIRLHEPFTVGILVTRSSEMAFQIV